MKKVLLALSAVVASAGAASAQVEIGLKLSPSITSLRTDAPTSLGLRGNSRVGIGGGLVVDYFFGQNYAFGTGLLLTGKGGKVSYLNAANQREEQKVSMQYLELPLTVKLFTNDIATDTKLYFQLGGSLNALIGGRVNGNKRYVSPTGSEKKATDYVITPDVAALLSIGVENQLGQSTKLFAGIGYHRGLVNVDKYFDKDRKVSGVSLKNDEVRLDVGIKF